MNLSRIRKAIWAGVLAGVAAVPGTPGVDVTDGITVVDVAAAAGGFVTAAILAGVAVYAVRNTGTVNGSDPRPSTRSTNAGHFPIR